MPARQLKLKCYLEGIEVPINSASISVATNAASRASIIIPPTNKGFRIRPRTHVHLFWLDDATSNWYLLWEGEVLALSFSKSPNGRGLSLECADMSNYWDFIMKMIYELNSDGLPFLSKSKLFFGNTAVDIAKVGDASKEKILEQLNKNDNLPEAIRVVLSEATNDIPYFSFVNEKYRINDQLVLTKDAQVQKMLSLDMIMSLTRNLVGSQREQTSIREIITSFASLIHYTHVSLGTPTYNASRMGLNSFILKPNIYGAVPPRCNVIFPDICSDIQYNHDFMSEPTRSWIKGQVVPLGDSLMTIDKTCPAYLYEQMAKAGVINSSDIFKTFTDEELEKGIIPQHYMLPFPELMSLDTSSTSNNIQYIQQYGDYMFQMARYAGRSLVVSTELNPWLACDFPCVVFDASRSYVANINSISHTIQATGGGYTQIQCRMARELELEDPAKDDSPYLPAWFCNSYRVNQVNDTYSGILGCLGLGENISQNESEVVDPSTVASGAAAPPAPFTGIPAKKTNLSKIASLVYNPAKQGSTVYGAAVKANAAYSFADGYRRRRLARMEDVFKVYDLSSDEAVPPTKFYGKMFDHTTGAPKSVNPGAIITEAEYKRNVVKAYADEINKSQVLDGR